MMHEKFPEGSNLARILRGDFQIHSCSHTSCGRSQHCRPCVAETPAVMSTLSLFNPSMSTKAAEQRTIIQEYGDWYTGRWWVGCYIWYSEEGTGRGRNAQAPPRCTKCNSQPINGQCTNFILFEVALPLYFKGLRCVYNHKCWYQRRG